MRCLYSQARHQPEDQPLSTAPRPLDLVPHRRYNPLTRRVDPGLSAAHAASLAGRDDEAELRRRARAMIPQCYLCPGNARSGGMHNPAVHRRVRLRQRLPCPAARQSRRPATPNPSPLLVAEPERGRCRVLCFHPDHSLTLARMAVPDIAAVVDAWADETATLGALPYINHVQIFENRGAMMGASNPHPHCQIWATEHIPDEPLRELASLETYHDEHEQLPALRLRGDRGRSRPTAHRRRERALRSRSSPTGRSGRLRRWCCRAATWAASPI